MKWAMVRAPHACGHTTSPVGCMTRLHLSPCGASPSASLTRHRHERAFIRPLGLTHGAYMCTQRITYFRFNSMFLQQRESWKSVFVHIPR